MLRNITSLILLFLGLIIILIGSVNASSDSAVDSDINIEVKQGASFSIEFLADVQYITLPANEIRYSQKDIEQASPEMLGAIKYALKSDIVSQIRSSFPNCIIASINELPKYNSGVFLDEYTVSLTADFFSINESFFSSDLINGLLDSGVFVNLSFSWTSLPGWNNTYSLILSNDLGFKRTDGTVKSGKISWDIFNVGDEQEVEIGTITLKDNNPTTSANQNESLSFLFSLDCRQTHKVNMSLYLKAERLNMREYEFLASILTLPSSLPADGVRLCVERNLTTLEEIKKESFSKYIEELKDSLKTSTFNQSFDTKFLWDEKTTTNCSQPYLIDNMDEAPPITGTIIDPSVYLSFHNISGKAFFGLINAGGISEISHKDVNFADVFDNFQHPASSKLYLPSSVVLNESEIVEWIQSSEFKGVFSSQQPMTYDSQKITRLYDINVKSTDLNLLSFFTGKTEVNLGIGFEKTRNIFVMKRSSALSIPEDIQLSYVNADAFRVCTKEEVFTEEEINKYVNLHEIELENFSRRLFPSIKGSAVNDETTLEDSLEWDGNITNMNADQPVIFAQIMESTAPLSCQFSFFPPHFSFTNQNLTFVGIPEETVTYNMTFPKGISVNVLSSSQPVVEQRVNNGQSLLSITLNASKTGKVVYVVLSMEPTIVYIIGLFVPCIISVFITILLFFVVYIIRKKRNKYRQQGQRPPSSHQDEGYENEEYYVPPKPPSSR